MLDRIETREQEGSILSYRRANPGVIAKWIGMTQPVGPAAFMSSSARPRTLLDRELGAKTGLLTTESAMDDDADKHRPSHPSCSCELMEYSS